MILLQPGSPQLIGLACVIWNPANAALFVRGEQLVAVERAGDCLPAHALVDVLVLVRVGGLPGRALARQLVRKIVTAETGCIAAGLIVSADVSYRSLKGGAGCAAPCFESKNEREGTRCQ